MSEDIHDERKNRAKQLIQAEDDFAHHWEKVREAELGVMGAQDRLREQQEFFAKAEWCLEQAKAAMLAALTPAATSDETRERIAAFKDRYPGFQAEQETAPAPVEIEIPAGFTKWEGGVCPVDPNTCISVMFMDGEISHDGVIAGNMNWAHDATCAVRIYAYKITEQASAQGDAFSFVAQSPVVRPVPGAGEESRDQFEERPALNSDMQDEREEPVALAQPEWNEPQPTEGYAPVTNPEADALARAHDYYDPKAVAERNRFNPFSIFRAKEDA